MVCLVFMSVSLKAQYSDLVFYSEHGNSFYVYLNGILQNDSAAPIVKVTNVVAPNYKCEIDFKNPRLYSIDKDLFFTAGLETNYVITKNKKNSFVLDFVSEVIRIQDTVNIKYRQIVNYTNKRNKSKKWKSLFKVNNDKPKELKQSDSGIKEEQNIY